MIFIQILKEWASAQLMTQYSLLAVRPYDGVAMLIRKRLRPVCEFQFYDDRFYSHDGVRSDAF